MIKIYVDRNQGFVKLSGHAGAGIAGSDIVCAGVSAITGALIERVQEFDEKLVRKGILNELIIRMPKGMTWKACFEMALAGWRLIEEEYPDRVQILTVKH